jgi:hypothetical protein
MSRILTSVVDPHHVDADPDSHHPYADPDSDFYFMRIRILILCGSESGFLFDAYADLDPTFHPDADTNLDPDPSYQIMPQNLEKVLSLAHNPYILACHLQIDANPDPIPDPAYHFDADPDPDFYLMRIRIRIFI